MGRYEPVEGLFLQSDKNLQSNFLAPRFEALVGGITYSNVNDLDTSIQYNETGTGLIIETQSGLVDKNRKRLTGNGTCEVRYSILQNEFIIHAKYVPSASGPFVKYVLPLISNSREKIWVISPARIEVVKSGTVVTIEANKPFKTDGEENAHIFGFVPGSGVTMLEFLYNEIEINIRIG
jgi:uncharacterized protein YbcI